jgi:hypothetical protein
MQNRRRHAVCTRLDRTAKHGATGMRGIRRIGVAILVAAALTAQAASVAAATEVTYGIRGIETAATATRGAFSGVAWAWDDYGTWSATVDHGAFDARRHATITGGTVTLDGARRDVSGSFEPGGTVVLTNADPGCGREFFDVDGVVAITRGGSGQFDATLTHYRTSFLGRCITYWATVRGSIRLSLP